MTTEFPPYGAEVHATVGKEVPANLHTCVPHKKQIVSENKCVVLSGIRGNLETITTPIMDQF